MQIREATQDDFWRVVDLAKAFMHEGHQRTLTWSDSEAWAYFYGIDQSPRATTLVVTDNGHIIGVAIVEIQATYTVEPLAYLNTFFIEEQHRGGYAAVRLLRNCVDHAKKAGAAMMYAASTAGLDDGGANNDAFRRLFSAVGFEAFGAFFHTDLRGTDG